MIDFLLKYYWEIGNTSLHSSLYPTIFLIAIGAAGKKIVPEFMKCDQFSALKSPQGIIALPVFVPYDMILSE
jgi:hypothetical protein